MKKCVFENTNGCDKMKFSVDKTCDRKCRFNSKPIAGVKTIRATPSVVMNGRVRPL